MSERPYRGRLMAFDCTKQWPHTSSLRLFQPRLVLGPVFIIVIGLSLAGETLHLVAQRLGIPRTSGEKLSQLELNPLWVFSSFHLGEIVNPVRHCLPAMPALLSLLRRPQPRQGSGPATLRCALGLRSSGLDQWTSYDPQSCLCQRDA